MPVSFYSIVGKRTDKMHLQNNWTSSSVCGTCKESFKVGTTRRRNSGHWGCIVCFSSSRGDYSSVDASWGVYCARYFLCSKRLKDIWSIDEWIEQAKLLEARFVQLRLINELKPLRRQC